MSNNVAVWGACSVVMILFFWLPYHVPASHTFDSLSARVGFNNKAAVVIMLAGLVLVTLVRIALRQTLVFASDPAQPQAIPTWLLLCATSGVTIQVLCIAWVTDGSSYYGEETYFLNRLLHLQAGHVPYRDFEFAYGPALLYPAFWFERVFGLSPHFAYSTLMWVFDVAGVLVLWALFRFAQREHRLRSVSFVVLLTGFVLSALKLDLQYTLFRFVSGFGALLVIDAVTRWPRGRWPLVSAICAVLTASVILISPEIGLAFVASLLAYMLIGILRGMHHLLWVVAGYALSMVFVFLLLPAGIFQAVTDYSSGAGAFPLLPSPYMLLYAGSLLWVISPICASILWALRFGGPPGLPFSVPLMGSFAVNAVALMPGALGRADGGHVLLYGFGVFLLALLVGLGGKRPAAYLGLFTAILCLVAFTTVTSDFPTLRSHAGQRFVHWSESHPDSAAIRFLAKLGGDRWVRLETRLRRVRDLSLESNYPDLNRYGRICVPFVEGIEGEFVLAEHGNLGLEYYHGMDGAFTPDQVKRKIDGLHNCSYVIIATEALAPANDSAQEAANDIQVMNKLLMCPFTPADHGPTLPIPSRSLLEYIATNYEILERLNSRLTLCKRRSQAW